MSADPGDAVGEPGLDLESVLVLLVLDIESADPVVAVGKPGLVHESAGQCLVLAVLCPGLVLATLGLGLALEAGVGKLCLDLESAEHGLVSPNPFLVLADGVGEAEPVLVHRPAAQGLLPVSSVPVLVLLEAVNGEPGLVLESARQCLVLGQCLVLAVLCPGLILATLGLGLVLEDGVVKPCLDLGWTWACQSRSLPGCSYICCW